MKDKVRGIFGKIMLFYEKRPIFLSLLISSLIILVMGIFVFIREAWRNGLRIDDIYGYFWGFILLTLFIVLPPVLTLMNLISLFIKNPSEKALRSDKKIELLIIFLGTVYSFLYLLTEFSNIVLEDWQQQLYNSQLHTPIHTGTMPTICAIVIIALLGYFLLRYKSLEKISPLLAVLGIAAMYLGAVGCILWIVQLWGSDFNILVLCILPANFIVIILKTIKDVIKEWRKIHQPDLEMESNLPIKENHFPQSPLLSRFYSWLMNSANWPLVGLLFTIPLLGVIILIMMLFGQQPDSVIKAWTETADWNLSQRIAPQNIMYDQHYLCTVAAGGHKKIVKPLRLGIRHGNEVIVNRQLCIANAFEQILEEKTPRLHALIRGVYDKYGYPIAKHIKSPYTADLIYFLMKPAEWFFLAVIYLCDCKPENRIAVQYMKGEHKIIKH